MKFFACKGCGHIAFNEAPDKCPVCMAPKKMFIEDPEAIKPAEKEGKEKHVPVLIKGDSCGLIPGECKDVHVKVGSVPHPMQDDHWITWIDVYLNKEFSARYSLSPKNLQAAIGLHIKGDKTGTLTVIENCNKHGRWMMETEI